MANIETLYQDKNKTSPIYPRSKTSAITDDNGVNVDILLEQKQSTLISGVNIKTINNESLLGEGNIQIQGGAGASSWNELTNKPFDSIDSETLVVENRTLKVNTINSAEQDNTQPITSAGVYQIVGNIEALLKVI